MSVSIHRSETVLGLFEQYYERVYCFARRSLPPGRAEDVAQEVFVRLLEHRDLESLTISVSYLLKVADNLMKRRYQRAQRFDRYLEEESRPSRTNGRQAADDSLACYDSEALSAALERLTANERDAVRLIVCDGKSYEAAAQSLGVNVTTVNNWKFRGLRKLRDDAERLDIQAGRPRAGDARPRTDDADPRRSGVDRGRSGTKQGARSTTTPRVDPDEESSGGLAIAG